LLSKNLVVLKFFPPKKCNVILIWFVLLCCIILALSGIEWHIPIFLSFLCFFLEIYSCSINVGFCARVIDMDLIRKNAKAFQFFSSFLNFKMLWGKFDMLFGSIQMDDICLGNGLCIKSRCHKTIKSVLNTWSNYLTLRPFSKIVLITRPPDRKSDINRLGYGKLVRNKVYGQTILIQENKGDASQIS